MIMTPASPHPLPSLAALLLLSIIDSDAISGNAFYLPTPSSIRNHAALAKGHITLARRRDAGHISFLSGDGETNMPSREEIAQQKQDAYNALSSFHETSSLARHPSAQMRSLLKDLDAFGDGDDRGSRPNHWACVDGAVAYSAPMDPAAGLKRGVVSKPYRCGVQVAMDLGELGGGERRKGLRLVESFQFGGDDDGASDGVSAPFVRSIPLGENVDVDTVDGSYSLDDAIPSAEASSESPSLPLLPPPLMEGIDSSAVQFVVEHTIAVSEVERCRCFFLYGDVGGKSWNGSDVEDDDAANIATEKVFERSNFNSNERNYRLLGVVLAEETKKMPESQPAEEERSPDDEVDYASEFISQIIEAPDSKSPSSPLDFLETGQAKSGDDKMSQLMESLEKHNKRVIDSSGGDGNSGLSTKNMKRHSLGMFGLTSGVWLGDTFIRESMPVSGQSSRIRQARQKGFGKKSKASGGAENGDEEDQFATWHLGVQKVALQFEWDYNESITQSFTYGKCMGTASSLSSMANIKSEGIVVINEARRTKKREERRVVWDMESGAYVAGLVGSSYFRAPRYLSFSQSRRYSADAYLTELLVFYQQGETLPSNKDKSNILNAMDGAGEDPEYYCSRVLRLYNSNDGKLMQGSSAFFSMKQPEGK